jgi:hypothetical protein
MCRLRFANEHPRAPDREGLWPERQELDSFMTLFLQNQMAHTIYQK